jgi:hypothetical protein
MAMEFDRYLKPCAAEDAYLYVYKRMVTPPSLVSASPNRVDSDLGVDLTRVPPWSSTSEDPSQGSRGSSTDSMVGSTDPQWECSFDPPSNRCTTVDMASSRHL